MGIFSLVSSVWNNLFAVLRWLRRLTSSPKPAVERNNDDKPTEAATEPKSPEWLAEKALFLSMPLSEKRVHYKCGFNYVTLRCIQTWTEYFNENKEWLQKLAMGRLDEVCDIDPELNEKISIWRGDITTLEIDAIVNAANESLLGGGGVDGAIHKAAGEMLRKECATLNGCKVGEAKVSGGYLLPAKYVIHTVGPRGSGDEELISCYKNSLNIMKELHKRSVAFPCISTAIFGFPNERAADIALKTARKFLQENRDVVDRIIFCLFMPVDVEIYEVLMQKYFPVCHPPAETTQVKDTEPEAVPSEEKTTVHVTSEETLKDTPPGVTLIKTETKEEPTEDQPLLKQADEQKEDANMKEPNQAGFQAHSEEADKAVSYAANHATKNGIEISDKTENMKSDEEQAVSILNTERYSEPGMAEQNVSGADIADTEEKPEEVITKTDETEKNLDISSEHKVTEPEQENNTLKTEHSFNEDEGTKPVTADEDNVTSVTHEDNCVEGMKPGTDEQSFTDKQEKNHSLMSDVTDFEDISLSEAQNKTTETNSSEEQHVKTSKTENTISEEQHAKTDKNENLPLEAITESKI